MSDDLNIPLPEEVLDAITQRVRAALIEDFRPVAWLDVERAAEYLSCKPQRIYDLVAQGHLVPARDGTRLLFRRRWLDDYVKGAR